MQTLYEPKHWQAPSFYAYLTPLLADPSIEENWIWAYFDYLIYVITYAQLSVTPILELTVLINSIKEHIDQKTPFESPEPGIQTVCKLLVATQANEEDEIHLYQLFEESLRYDQKYPFAHKLSQEKIEVFLSLLSGMVRIKNPREIVWNLLLPH